MSERNPSSVVNLKRAHTLAVANRILKLLASEALTTRGVADRAYMTQRQAVRYLNTMHDARMVHIADWIRDHQNMPRPAYAAGNAPDRKKPDTSPRTKGIRWYARLKKERPEEHVRKLALWKARRLRPKRDPAAAWITGDQA